MPTDVFVRPLNTKSDVFKRYGNAAPDINGTTVEEIRERRIDCRRISSNGVRHDHSGHIHDVIHDIDKLDVKLVWPLG